MLKDLSRQEKEELLETLKKDPAYLAMCAEQHPAMCITAVIANPDALQYVRDQTPDICKFALDKDPHALGLVRDQDLEVCRYAVGLDPMALEYAEVQDEQMCLSAVKENWRAFEFVQEPTEAVCEMLIDCAGADAAFCLEDADLPDGLLNGLKEKYPEVFDAPQVDFGELEEFPGLEIPNF